MKHWKEDEALEGYLQMHGNSFIYIKDTEFFWKVNTWMEF